MTVLEYVARFIELARFADDYVVTTWPRSGDSRMD